MGGTLELGKWGETQALDFLLSKDYRAVSQGYRTRFGEIDLIVKNNEFIIFVEVKVRKNSDFAMPREYVGHTKQSKIIATAQMWLAKHETALQPRFDVIEVFAPDGIKTDFPRIIHLENAF